MVFRFCAFIILLSLFFISCKKESYITSRDASLSTTTDTLFFDTVFTSTGSVTKSFKIVNDNAQKIRLSKVKLMGGSSSYFKLNIDGVAGLESDNIDIAANDSIYVFVQVNVTPSAERLPFIISDSVLINYNGNDKFVQLQAYGQNAHFLKNKVILADETWNNVLPYVILGGVAVGPEARLTLTAGTRVYSHADAPFLVDGTLVVNGTKESPVIFKGDRLDQDYKTLPAGWPGIFFRTSSQNNSIRFGQILNAYQAIVLQDPSGNSTPKLVISQSIVDNAYSSGIAAFNSSVQADNSLISNCGNNIVLQAGVYQFTNCTVAAYSNYFIEHKNPVLQIADMAAGTAYPLSATFVNNIFWGDSGIVKSEVQISRQGSDAFSVQFNHDLMRLASTLSNATLTGVISNVDPRFDSIDVSKRIFDFHFTKNISPALHAGVSTPFTKDLDDNLRPPEMVDLGCYQK